MAGFFARLIKCIQDSNDPSDVSRTNVDGKFVGEAVNPYLKEHADSGTRLPLDGEYWTTSADGFDTIRNEDLTDKRPYKSAKYDCENFALTFMSNAQSKYGVTTIGLVIDWSGGHAYNMIVFDDGTVKLFEPQNDNFVEPGSKDRFAFKRVRVII